MGYKPVFDVESYAYSLDSHHTLYYEYCHYFRNKDTASLFNWVFEVYSI